MSEQEITAGELDDRVATRRAGALFGSDTEALARAARTIRRLEGEVAGWKSKTWSDATYALGEAEADRELGSLVRRIREHPEAAKVEVAFTMQMTGHRWSCHADTGNLNAALVTLGQHAQRRAAEEGERGPSGDRFRVKDGGVSIEHRDGFGWAPCLKVRLEDVRFVADLLERVRKGVPRGE